MTLLLHIVTIPDMYLPQMQTFAGIFLVNICVFIISQGILKPTDVLVVWMEILPDIFSQIFFLL